MKNLQFIFILVALLVAGNSARAEGTEQLVSLIDEATREGNVEVVTNFNPPLLDNQYRFLALTPDENPYPASISYGHAVKLKDRANSICLLMTGLPDRAESLVLEQMTDVNGEFLAFTHDGLALVDKFYPIGAKPVAVVKKIGCR